jgi:hypothetical protein
MAVLSSTDYPIAVAWVLLGFGALHVVAVVLDGWLRPRSGIPAGAGVASQAGADTAAPAAGTATPVHAAAPAAGTVAGSAPAPERGHSPLRHSLPVLGATIVFIGAIPILGFYLATTVYLSALLYGAMGALPERRTQPRVVGRIGLALVVAAATVAIVYLVFDVWLSYFLPRGRIW